MGNYGNLLANVPGREKDAELNYRYALSAGNEAVWFNLGLLLARQGDRMQDAEQAFRRAIQADDAKAYRNLGALLASMPGRQSEAEQVLREAIAAGVLQASNDLAIMLADRGELKEAEDRFWEAIQTGMRDAIFNLASFLLQQPGRGDEAGSCIGRRSISEITKRRTTSPRPSWQRGRCRRS